MKADKFPEIETLEKEVLTKSGSETEKGDILKEHITDAPDEDIHKGEPGLLHKLMRKKKLEGFFLFVTSRCNAKCKTCFYHEELNSNEDMTFEEIKKMSG